MCVKIHVYVNLVTEIIELYMWTLLIFVCLYDGSFITLFISDVNTKESKMIKSAPQPKEKAEGKVVKVFVCFILFFNCCLLWVDIVCSVSSIWFAAKVFSSSVGDQEFKTLQSNLLTYNMALEWQACSMPDATECVLSQAGLMPVHCDLIRL